MEKNISNGVTARLFLMGSLLFLLSSCESPAESLDNLVSNSVSTAPPGPKASTTPSPSPTVTSTPSPKPTPSPTTTPQVYKGPKEVEKYVLKFIDDGKAEGINVLPGMQNPILVIQLENLDSYGGGVIGLCETGSQTRRVTFDPDFWNKTDETQRELLAHHEFGHCVLGRPHRQETLSSGKYASIMYPVIMSSVDYLNNYQYYLEELFTWQDTQHEIDLPHTHICNQGDL